jgi:predicted alpha/beta superfamily hydrolase
MYPDNYVESNSYKTIYLLDGDWYYNEFSEIVHDKYGENVILISIGYASGDNRNTDFTFPADDLLKKSGGAKQYAKFITEELTPYIENNLKIKSSSKALLGHSLGGYFALYLTFQKEVVNPFNKIVAISPSLYWSDAYIFGLEEEYSKSNNNLNVSLYIAMGDLEGATMNTHFDAILSKLKSRNYQGLSLNYERLKNTVHNNSPIIGFEKGISINY